MKRLFVLDLLVILTLQIFQSCKKDNNPPVISFLIPQNDTSIIRGDSAFISIFCEDPDGDLNMVRLYKDNSKIYSSSAEPYLFYWSTTEENLGIKHFLAVAEDDAGNISNTKREINIYELNIVLKLDSVSEINTGSALVYYSIEASANSRIKYSGICLSTAPNPDSSNIVYQKDYEEDTMVTVKLDNLNPGKKYYVRAIIVKEKGVIYSNELTFITGEVVVDTGEVVVDIDGNIYQTIKIGDQVWMAENLKVTHYNNRDDIPNVTEIQNWYNIGYGAYCNYNNDPGTVAENGRYYNGFSVRDPRNICPVGWHVPTDQEWTELEISVGLPQSELTKFGVWRGTDQNVGTKLKVNGSSEFDAKLCGGRGWYSPDNFKDINIWGAYWASTIGINYPVTNNFARSFKDTESGIYRSEGNIHSGLSIRCLKD